MEKGKNLYKQGLEDALILLNQNRKEWIGHHPLQNVCRETLVAITNGYESLLIRKINTENVKELEKTVNDA